MFIRCTTVMDDNLSADFQVMAATWVAERSTGSVLMASSEPIGSTSTADALSFGRDAAMTQWTDEDLGWFVARRNPAKVGTHALAYLVANPDMRLRGEDIAAEIHLDAPDDAKAREMISGAFGWIGRDCNVRHLPLPFMFDESSNEYWATAEQAKALSGAGL